MVGVPFKPTTKTRGKLRGSGGQEVRRLADIGHGGVGVRFRPGLLGVALPNQPGGSAVRIVQVTEDSAIGGTGLHTGRLKPFIHTTSLSGSPGRKRGGISKERKSA